MMVQGVFGMPVYTAHIAEALFDEVKREHSKVFLKRLDDEVTLRELAEVMEASKLKVNDPDIAMFGIAGYEEEVIRFAEVLERRINAFLTRTQKNNYLERLEALYNGPSAEKGLGMKKAPLNAIHEVIETVTSYADYQTLYLVKLKHEEKCTDCDYVFPIGCLMGECVTRGFLERGVNSGGVSHYFVCRECVSSYGKDNIYYDPLQKHQCSDTSVCSIIHMTSVFKGSLGKA